MMLTRSYRIVLAAVALWCAASQADDDSLPVDFNRDIRPILSDVCFKCHGPDAAQRVTTLRLDTREGAFADLPDGPAIIPGNLDESQLYRRITSLDDDIRMPPPDSGRALNEQQIELLAEWIRQDAPWQQHWAFVSPRRPLLPQTQTQNWRRNPIDSFVLARLEGAGLAPSPAADKTTQIRRVTLGLTGLPPTPQEVEAFLNDTSEEAWEQVVDRLLASDRYGERMAIGWLDAARYADTSGYQNDGPRDMWRWRDWVVGAFNANMPFDQFTIEQLAGDLLPNPTLNQRIATGFNRNHRGNAEGGIIPEEYQVEYVVDRVDTTSTVWLGLTMGCARCHDHKYDPISQIEFYQVFAYFNNIPESGRAIKEGNSPPYIKAPTADQQQQLTSLDAKIAEAERTLSELEAELRKEQARWEAGFSSDRAVDWTVTDELSHRFELNGSLADTVSGNTLAQFTHAEERFAPGRYGDAAAFNGTTEIDAGDIAGFGYFDKFSITAWIRPTESTGTVVSRMIPAEQGAGYYLHLQDGRLQVNLVKRWLDDSIRVESLDRLLLNEWQHVTVTYDGSRVAKGVKAYLDGEPLKLAVRLDGLNQSFETSEPFRIGGGQSHFAGNIDNVHVYRRVLTPVEAAMIAVPESISAILRIERDQRTSAQASKLTQYFIEQHSAQNIRSAHERLTRLRRRRQAVFEAIPTVMVMEEMSQPRPTYVLTRGQYDAPADAVSAGVPRVFPPLPEAAPNDRLGFARWLVSPSHPLTARVTVNHLWQMHFGTGLVKTTEDFGTQGDLPSHPDLLDWLAIEFIQSGWDLKVLHKLIVTSATYRQSSQSAAELRDHDPENRLLARGARYRLPAETIRDQALFVSGLLTPTIGGPPVRPYQPEGLWKEIASTTNYEQSQGDDLYRRSLYTYWKRTVAPPTMVTLDATSREACTVKRSRTNTPLQALALMNEVTFVEAARVLAQRLLADGAQTPEEPIREAFQRVTGRKPRTEELHVLCDAYDSYLSAFREDTAAAEELISVGEFPVDEELDPSELAALTTVSSLILNLDEVLNIE